MSRTPARKRGEDGRLLPLEEAQPDQGPGPDNFGEGVWEAGEDFGSVGPAAFGTPEQQASLIADTLALRRRVVDAIDDFVADGGQSTKVHVPQPIRSEPEGYTTLGKITIDDLKQVFDEEELKELGLLDPEEEPSSPMRSPSK